ncbi:hypothetical protein N431DRAFT_563447 [Stipitochalara longipes BDJ]|nr:hypothetical protein N431DRAFT_563447 [Stipitochalara longipes BDJ]
MQFFSIIATSMLATLAVSAPVADAPSSVETVSRSTELIDLWQDADFLGLKFTGSSTVGTCVELHGTGFDDNVTSGKSKPGFRCTIWVETECKGTGFSFNANPGIAQLPSWIDNQAKSWKCVDA